jgi:hypothetical protein
MDDGIVVVEVEKGRSVYAGEPVMQANLVPTSLRDRLGLEATNALLELLDKACD